MKEYQQLGITLLEGLMVIAILGIVTAAAVPSYQEMIERNRLKQVAESFKSDLQFARTEAIKRSMKIKVSRTTGNAGAWCYGLTSKTASCACNQTNSAAADYCEIKRVSGADFSVTTMRADGGGTETFDFRRGTIGNDSEIFSTSNYEIQVVFGQVGRVRICTPSAGNLTTGKKGLPAVASC